MDHVHFAESNSDDTPLSRTLYVTNLSYASLRSDLERLFSSFGTIGRFGDRLLNSRGMAFITYVRVSFQLSVIIRAGLQYMSGLTRHNVSFYESTMQGTRQER